jgi:hypothetical protein
MTAKLDKTIKRELEIEGKTYTIAIAPDGIKVTAMVPKSPGNPSSTATPR